MLAPSIANPLPRVKQKRHDHLRYDREMRPRATRMACGLLAGVPQKVFRNIPGMSSCAISRWINGHESNAFYRISAALNGCRKHGVSRGQALQAVVWLSMEVDTLWPPDEVDYRTARIEEEIAENEVDQLQAVVELDPTVNNLMRLDEAQMIERARERDYGLAVRRRALKQKAPLPASNGARCADSHRPIRTARI